MKSFAAWSIVALAFASGCSSEKTLDKLNYMELSILLDTENAELDRRTVAMNSDAFGKDAHNREVQLRTKAWDREKQLVEADEPETYEHYMKSEEESLKALSK